jgi:hypothetical protein
VRVCDCLVALGPATVDGHTLFAKNSDRPPAEEQVAEWFPARRETSTRATYVEVDNPGNETIGFIGSRPAWMWGVEHGVNEAGVAAGNATIYTMLDPRPFPDGVTGMDIVRLALERTTNAASAVELIGDLLARYGQGGSGHEHGHRPYWSSFLVADPAEAFVIETSGAEFATEAVTRTRATSNRTTIAGFDDAHRHPGQPVERLVDPRLAASNAVLRREPVSVDTLAAHLRSHAGGEDGYTICMHVPDVEATRASIVAELPRTGPPVAWMGTGSPCLGNLARVVVDGGRLSRTGSG